MVSKIIQPNQVKNNSIFENGRQPQSLFEIEKRHRKKCNKKQLKVNGCDTAPGNLVF